eukprot:10295150-Alexandrium_andersonii.AAC.1
MRPRRPLANHPPLGAGPPHRKVKKEAKESKAEEEEEEEDDRAATLGHRPRRGVQHCGSRRPR